jgi:hypothetical protein
MYKELACLVCGVLNQTNQPTQFGQIAHLDPLISNEIITSKVSV